MTAVRTVTSPTTVRRVMREYEAEVVVQRRVRVADRIVAFELAEAGGHILPEWQPGAHIDVLMGEKLARQYSLCGDPGDRFRWRIAVLREEQPRTPSGSHHMHDLVAEGDRLRIRGPRNQFPLDPAAEHLFVAGGVGITPILPMVAEAQAAGRPWRLVYGARSTTEMAFTDELAGHGDRVTLVPQDTDGLIDVAGLVAAAAPGTAVHCCGPAPLLRAIREAALGRPMITLRTERFGADAADPAADHAFDVVLVRSGETVRVQGDQSILHAVEATGRRLLSSCRAGMCGTCETTVVEGVPDHRDSVLTVEEQNSGETMMICVSRCAADRLVLDI
ncbi:2Fe-2S iron-sulfur cluster-binding protein [Nocardia sp. R6R-6]|uniref:2Fe-2S iron-sulfur cluster-binding protein n=1 Tax=Nocardia sp. R6R-6 TaxID=3459303 RepID=UPI00403E0BA5